MMPLPTNNTVFYKRSNFVTHLPAAYLYSPTHCWAAPLRLEDPAAPENHYRVGFTKFATRMLGEIVDHQFEKRPGEPVQPGEIIGSIEGFKAISDLYCILDGRFVTGNPALTEKIELVTKDPYGAGWLYVVEGIPDRRCISLPAYRELLDGTIDRILATQKGEDADAPASEAP